MAGSPNGQPGRPSKSLTLGQAAELLRTSDGTRIGAPASLSAPAPASAPRKPEPCCASTPTSATSTALPAPGQHRRLAVGPRHGHTKTARSRRTLGLPAFAAQALRELQQREDRNTGPVFATRDGHELDAANVRREFTAAINTTGIPGPGPPESSATPSSASCPTPASRRGNRPPRRPRHHPHHRDRLPAPTPASPRTGAQAMDQLPAHPITSPALTRLAPPRRQDEPGPTRPAQSPQVVGSHAYAGHQLLPAGSCP
jgi:hypothetical protein